MTADAPPNATTASPPSAPNAPRWPSASLLGSASPYEAATVSRHARTWVEIVTVDSELAAAKSADAEPGTTAILREANVLARVRHPNVVELVRCERAGDEATLVTQFAGRDTFATCELAGSGDIARLGAALATIVADLHRSGWVHGRIRADHCLVDGDGRVTLCSFGAAIPIDDPAAHADADVDAVRSVIRELGERWVSSGGSAFRRDRRALRRIGAAASSGPAVDRQRRPVDPPTHVVLEGIARRLQAAATAAPATTPTARASTTRRRRATTARSSPSTNRRVSGAPRPARGPSRLTALATTAATTTAMLAALWFLRWVGGPIGLDATHAAGRVARWSDLPEPVLVAAQIVRVVAAAAAIYGVALSAATFAAVLTRRPELERVALRLAPPRLRRTIAALIGAGLLVSVATDGSARSTTPHPTTTSGRLAATQPAHSAPTTAAAPTAAAPTTAASAATTPTATTPTTTTPTTTTPPTTSAPLATATTTPEPTTPSDLPAVAAVAQNDAAAADPTVHRVVPGEHLWMIAERAVSTHLGRRATDAEIDRYWRVVIEANRATFLHPDEPDLIVPGELVVLPPVDAGGS